MQVGNMKNTTLYIFPLLEKTRRVAIVWSAYGQDRAQPQLLKPPLCTLWHPVITSCVQTH